MGLFGGVSRLGALRLGDAFCLKSLGSSLAAHDYRPIPIIVLALSLLATLGSWYVIATDVDSHVKQLASDEADEIVHDISQQFYAAEQMMHGAHGLLRANSRVTAAQWNGYVSALEDHDPFPSGGLGFAKLVLSEDRPAHIANMRREGLTDYDIKPAGERPYYAPVISLAPRSERLRVLAGFDVLSEPIYREALERARDTDKASVSAKSQIGGATGLGGTLSLFIPIYGSLTEPVDVEARRRTIDGFVFSTFEAADFLQAAVEQRRQRFDMALFEGTTTDQRSLLYETRPNFSKPLYSSELLQSRMLDIGGRIWTLILLPTEDFILENRSREPLIILQGGIGMSLLLFALTLVLSRDIARRRMVEDSIRAAERRLRSIFENAPVALCLRDREGRHVIANETFAESHGVALSAVVGKKVSEFSRRPVMPNPQRDDDEVMAEGVPRMGERRIVLPNGEPRFVLSIKYPVVDQTGRGMEVCRIGIDITEWKKVEDQLRHIQKLEAIGQLTGGIAHDFNNLLQVISGNAELLSLDYENDQTIKRPADNIIRASGRAAELTKRLLAFSRRQNLDFRIVDVNQSVNHFEGMLNRTLGEKIRIKTVLCEGTPLVRLDAAELETAILNLAVNARDAMPDGGTLIIETAIVELNDAYLARRPYARLGPNVMLAISDTGTGIAPEVLDHVFEPFFTTKGVGRGSGMGLSMVYGFVKQSNGHVEIYSEVGQGTIIKMFFPYVEDAIAASPHPESPAEEADLVGSETILVAEDDPGVREYVIGQLTHRGYRVLAAADGASAIEVAQSNPGISLLFTDIVMPGNIDGIELATRLARFRPGMRFLFTSGYSAQALLSHKPLPGGNPVLSKPYGALSLARRVREVLDSPA